MEKTFENEICSIRYSDEEKCLYHDWKKKTEDASWDEIKTAFLKYVEFVEEFRPQKILVDEQQMHHIFLPEEGKWIDENFMPRIVAVQTERTAIVKSEDIYVEMATDMMMQQDAASKIQSRFFGSKKDAEDWLHS